MLNELRQQATNPFILLLLLIIGVVFVFTFGSWGGSEIGDGPPIAATVNGKVIQQQEFLLGYSNAFRNASRGKPQYDKEDAKRDNLRARVLDELIEQELLAQAAERRGLVATDEEVRKIIKSRYFGGDVEFNREEYKKLVNNSFRTTEARFEDRIRRQLMADKISALVSDSQKVSPAELKDAFESRNNRASLEVVRIDPLYFKDIPVASEAEIAAWADANEEKTKEFYDGHINRYRQPKKVKASHILVKVSPDAADDAKAAAKAKIDAAKKRVDGGEDFAAVAKDVSEDSSAAGGGSLGFFGPGAMVKPFEEQAFKMKAGEVSDVVTTKFGYHIIKVDEVQEAKIRELDDVKLEIAKQLQREEAQMVQAKALAEKALADLKAGKDPATLELPDYQTPASIKENPEAPGNPFAPQLNETGLFAKSAKYIPRIGIAPEVVTAAFELSKDKPVSDKVWEVSGRLYVIKLKEREEPDPSKFDAEKENLERTIAYTRQRAVIDAFLEQLKKDATIEKEQSVLNYGI